MRITRSAYLATPGSWVTSRIVIPSAFSRRNISSRSTLVAESRLPVGSSARSNAGRLTSDRAIATRCCWPPDICDDW